MLNLILNVKLLSNETHIKSINNLHSFLEKECCNINHTFDLTPIIRKLHTELIETKNEKEAQKVEFELLIFSWFFGGLLLKPIYKYTDKDSKNVEWPKVEDFSDELLIYTENRLNESINPILKSRYAMILWISKKKSKEYAKIIINSQLRILNSVINKPDKIKLESGYIIDIFNSLLEFSTKIKYEEEAVKLILLDILHNFDYNDNWSFSLRINLIRIVLEYKKLFKKGDYKNLDNVCMKVAKISQNDNKYFQAREMYGVGEKIGNKLGLDSTTWKKNIALMYEMEYMQLEKNNPNRLLLLESAITFYRKCKCIRKAKDLEKILKTCKNDFNYLNDSFEIDLDAIYKKCNKYTTEYFSGDSQSIISNLIIDNCILPEYKSICKIVDKNMKKYIAHNFFTTVIVDKRGNKAKNYRSSEEIKTHYIMEQYYYKINFMLNPLLETIFINSIINNKMNYQIFIEYLNTNTWLGQDITKIINNRDLTYNWLNLVAPAINEYFNQTDFYLRSKTPPNYILCIDSLTLKIEGMIRDLFYLKNISTIKYSTDKNGDNIQKELNLYELLNSEEIKNIFNEDEVNFFKYLLTDQGGYNMRNEIAHAFYHYDDYSIHKIHLLIFSLLKISQYKLLDN